MVWDAAGMEICKLKGHKGPYRPNSFAFSPNGKSLASAGQRGSIAKPSELEIKVWNLATGQEVLELGNSLGNSLLNFPGSVAISPSGKNVAWAGGVISEDFQKKKLPGIQGLEGVVKIWNATTGQVELTIKSKLPFTSLSFSPDGKRLATGETSGGKIGEASCLRVWDVITGKEISSWKTLEPVQFNVRFTPDGKRIAAWVGPRIQFFEANTGQQGLSSQSGDISFTIDGKYLLTAPRFTPKPTVKLWDAVTGEELNAFPLPAASLKARR